jgi:hypothetical protein
VRSLIKVTPQVPPLPQELIPIAVTGPPDNRINIVIVGDGYTRSQEPFTDWNANGRWDAGDWFFDRNGNGVRDTGADAGERGDEPYTDDDSDGMYTPPEPFDDRNNDGVYSSEDQERFIRDVGIAAKALLGVEPYKTYAYAFNVYALHSESVQAGASGSGGVRHNAFDSRNVPPVNRLLTVHTERVTRYVRTRTRWAENIARRIVVLVNRGEGGGGSPSIAVVGTGKTGSFPRSQQRILVHEFGHTFADLADEYEYAGSDARKRDGPEAWNVTRDPKGSKWAHWIENPPDPARPLTPIEGAFFSATGWYRLERTCLMRDLNADYCVTCRERTVVAVWEQVSLIDTWAYESSMRAPGRGYSRTFEMTPLGGDRGGHTIEWMLDGKRVSGGTTCTIAAEAIKPGSTMRVIFTENSLFVGDPNAGSPP